MKSIQIFRAEILHFLGDPQDIGESRSIEYFNDGIMIVEDGHVHRVGDAEAIIPKLPEGVRIQHYPHHLILPGFIDTHIHYPQSEMMASYGEQLIEWLEKYTFPAEAAFSNVEKAADVSEFFLDELLRNGTTTALVFATVHKESVEAFFQAAHARNLRMICGKVLMDRNAYESLHDTPETGYQDSKELIEKWLGFGRLGYAVSPRFAFTSSPEQLTAAGRLLQEYPGVYMQTHLSENQSEVAGVKSLFPDACGYLDVYDRFALLGDHSVFAHCIHLTDG